MRVGDAAIVLGGFWGVFRFETRTAVFCVSWLRGHSVAGSMVEAKDPNNKL